jgi:hypothetical protein
MPSRPYRIVTAATHKVGRTDNIVLVDSTAQAVTVTLPDATGRRDNVTISRIAGANLVTVDTFDTDTVDGVQTVTLTENGSSLVLAPQKDKYHVVSSHGAVNVGGKVGARFLTGSATWNPAATAATQGARVSTTVTVTGAVAGDTCQASHTAFDGSQAAFLDAHVTAADTVTVYLINTTAVAVDMATGTVKVVVWKS